MRVVSIYSQVVKIEAERFGITELQAWRKLRAREEIRKKMNLGRG